MPDQLGEWMRSVASAFGLGKPDAWVERSRAISTTWRLETAEGAYLVKTVPRGFEEQHAAAMRFESEAAEAGIAMPRAVEPVDPAYGFVAEIGGELVRVHPWHEATSGPATVDPRWLGETLKTLHDLQPLEHRPEPQWYGIDTPDGWERRIAEGHRRGKVWAEPLRRRKKELLDATAWVAEAFGEAGDYVFTHRDVEPWNILHTANGPLLVDWA
jgi:hypothetical protein